jgi:hypothetical protein
VWGGGCIRHLNKVVKYMHVWICIVIVIWLNPPNCRSNNNLENGMLSSLGNSKGPCWSSSSFNTIGSLPYDLFSPPFSLASNIKSSDNIFFLYHAMGLVPSCSRKSLLLMYMYTKSFAQFGKFGPLHSFQGMTQEEILSFSTTKSTRFLVKWDKID